MDGNSGGGGIGDMIGRFTGGGGGAGGLPIGDIIGGIGGLIGGNSANKGTYGDGGGVLKTVFLY